MLTERVRLVLQEIETLNFDEKRSLVEYINKQNQEKDRTHLHHQQKSHGANGQPLEFSSELEWLREHRHEYAGQYVALVGDNIVANGLEPRAILREARERGYSSPLIVRIEAPDELPFGGW